MSHLVDSDDDEEADEFYDPAEYAETHQHQHETISLNEAIRLSHNDQTIQHHHDQSVSSSFQSQSTNPTINVSIASSTVLKPQPSHTNKNNQSNNQSNIQTNNQTNIQQSNGISISAPIAPSSSSRHIRSNSLNALQSSNSFIQSTAHNQNVHSTNQSFNQSRPPQSPSAQSMSSQREMSRELSNSSIRLKHSTSPRDPPNQSINQSSNQAIDQSMPLRNLDTDETCQMHDAQLFFPEVGAALTMAQLEAYERSKLVSSASNSQMKSTLNDQSIPSADSIKLTESEVNERRRTLGILGKIAKTFSIGSSNSSNKATAGGKVKTKSKHCQIEILDDLIHAQTLIAANGPIWCVAVSHDGQFVATGGQDSIVRVWAIVGSMAARQLDERIRSSESGEPHSLNDPVHGRLIVHPTPFRVCSGHRADITCLSWSHSDDFLLSSSIDKTVCLWHVSSSRCIRVFPHTDLITCIAFHPREHRYFISGSFDNRIRLWNIIECRVVEWAQTAHFVTALTFSPSGHMVVAGLHHGQCVFYATAGLKYHTQVDCRNRSGKHARGKKVTGLEYSKDGSLLLVTTNDSRVRCYRMTDFGLHCKMKGVENESLQIKATLYEEQGQLHAICGSDKEICAVWKIPAPEIHLHNHQRENENSTSRSQSQSYNSVSTLSPPVASSGTGHAIKLDAYEYFKAIDDSPVTCALFLPTSSIAFSSANESQSAMPIRHIVLASGLHGEIKMYENRLRPPDYLLNQNKSKR